MVNRVEADPKPPDFVRVVSFETPSCQLNSLPVFFGKRCIVIDIESGTYARTRSDMQNISYLLSQTILGELLFEYPVDFNIVIPIF